MLAGRTSPPDILDAIDCFTAQTYPYKELVIVNNAKTQFDAAALNIQARRDVVLIDTPHELSAGMARNYGISTANGPILAQFDPDYWFAPNRLEAQVATLAQNEAAVSVLASTLQYSFLSGRASRQTNDRKAILGTMVFIRPKNIDYPNADKQEELGILEGFQNQEASIVSMDTPGLACKWIFTARERKWEPEGDLSREDLAVVRSALKGRRGR